jgi:hypothetical protein
VGRGRRAISLGAVSAGCADGVGVAGIVGGSMLGLGATAVGGGAVAVGDGAADGATEDRGGAGWCVESSDTVRTLNTSTIRATIPIPPPKTTSPQSDHRVWRCPSAQAASLSGRAGLKDCPAAIPATLRKALRTSWSRVASRRGAGRVPVLPAMVMVLVRETLSSGMTLKIPGKSTGRSSALTQP